MATLANGGRAEIVDGKLVVAALVKSVPDPDLEGFTRSVPLSDEGEIRAVLLSAITEYAFTRAARKGDPGALVVKYHDGELLLRLTEEEALPLVAQLHYRELRDADVAGSVED